ncbi:hypothetical protein PC9H_001073 [Pleurotus ostreatus]|uniref:Mediator complex subunit 16 n=1 Tax=Pleurotus ostreatus TaxID=5322 RepID=A0A8H7A273_PLEOS|nr:uncharacterized protein PC9H_001073 [Pleurotus ostreatus]KAF7440725.1 hypothetical protein PC9H_001073 [Pleurotus ostreatus]KAJ8699880.1 hypothetical protein PTI98_002957 [Pleurotus ostreatus]
MMLHDQKAVSLSPSKGKAKEDDHWNVGWWEFHSLVEQPRRPIEWSDVSVIFTAHPTKPAITGRHFPSSTHFVLHPPSPKVTPPFVYLPPTVITCSSGSEWLFAYFPGQNTDGMACIWKRGTQINVWTQRHAWPVGRGAAVMAAVWLGSPREWSIDPSTSKPTRLPPRGPHTPVTSPTLVIVTQDRRVFMWFVRNAAPGFRSFNCPLVYAGSINETVPQSMPNDPVVGPGGVRLCTHAAIGLVHNDTTILVAMRTASYPIPTDEAAAADHIGMPPVPPDRDQDWASWGEMPTIELAEVQLVYNGVFMSMIVAPLPSIHHPTPGLTQLSFICTPPLQPPTLSSPKRNDHAKGNVHLAVTCLDFSNYTTTPKSSLSLYRFTKGAGPPHWKPQLAATRLWDSSVVAFVLPQVQHGSRESGFYVAVLDTYGSTTRRKSQATAETPIGSLCVLNFSDLADSEHWDSAPLVCPVDRLGRELPLNAAVSPNLTLFVTVTSGLGSVLTAVHSLPRAASSPMQISNDVALQRDTLSLKLTLAMLSKWSTEDITQPLSQRSIPLSNVVEVIDQVHGRLEGLYKGLSDSLTWDMLGELIEIYRQRENMAESGEERDSCHEKWQTAHDMASLATCIQGFELCNDGELYDLSAVWQLISLSTWLIDFVEKVMKEAILSYNVDDIKPEENSAESTTSMASLNSPILLHLAHPYALTNFRDGVRHVKQFHIHLGSISTRGENALLAKNVLDDLVDACGVDLGLLESLLNDVLLEAKSLPGDQLRRSLDACAPLDGLHGHIRKTLQRINHSAAVDKPKLFLKPADLVDGIVRLSLESHKKDNRDVISKGLLLDKTIKVSCIRCSGTSSVPVNEAQNSGGRLPRWRLWEKGWENHCICWGLWAHTS